MASGASARMLLPFINGRRNRMKADAKWKMLGMLQICKYIFNIVVIIIYDVNIVVVVVVVVGFGIKSNVLPSKAKPFSFVKRQQKIA